MTYQQLRNLLVLQLFQYLDGPRVVLSDQVMPESEYPYLYYQGIQLRIPGPFNVENQAGTEHVQNRREQAQATFSYTACSRTEDEALELAERAQSFFLCPGRKILAAHGVAVLEVQNVQSRSAFEIDETDRRYGFDLLVRYEHVESRHLEAMDAPPITFDKEDS